MEHKPELLLADLDERTRTLCGYVADSLGYELVIATDPRHIISMIERKDIGVVLLDLDTINKRLIFIREIKSRSARIEVILFDEKATTSVAVQAIKAGASDYLEKPLRADLLEKSLTEALDRWMKFQPSISTLEELEKQAIERALAQAHGDKVEAARLLSIGKTTIYRKLRQYGNRSRRSRNRSTNSA